MKKTILVVMILLVVFCFLMVYDNNEQYKSGEQNRGLILMLSGALLLLGVFTLLLLKNYRCLKRIIRRTRFLMKYWKPISIPTRALFT